MGHALVIGSDQQSMVGVWVIAMVLREEVQISRLACRIVTGHSENRDVDMGKLLAEGQQVLPVSVITRMIQPANEDGVVLPIEPPSRGSVCRSDTISR